MALFKRVVLGLSGGLDSAVSGLLLNKKGYEVIGVFMRNWDSKDELGFCQSDKDAEDAEWVCRKLDIPFHEVNFVKEYWNEVFSYLLTEYKNGRTPNPDIYCNKHLKFDHFLKYAQDRFEAQAIATGHYARSSFGECLEYYDPKIGAKLLQSLDRIKDQTYFLCRIPQLALQKTMFPVGNINKEIVRKIARASCIERIADRKESMGICFIGKRDFGSFISQYIDDNPGDFVDFGTKEKVGRHRGFHQWTVGQRAKLSGFNDKYFIHSKDVESNTIYVVRGSTHPSLFSSSLYVHPFEWIHKAPQELFAKGQLECQFRFQNTHPLVDCVVVPRRENPWQSSFHPSSYIITTSHPMRAITPGQFAVIYKEEECLGSAVIERSGPSLYDLNVNNCRSILLAQLGKDQS